jgi:hypothetical protein
MTTESTTKRDYSAPARTEFEGREFTAEISFCLVEDATDDEIWQWLEYELGGGSISSSHPLVENGASLNRMEVTDLRRTGRSRFTDWGPTTKDGRCSGRGRTEYDEKSA